MYKVSHCLATRSSFGALCCFVVLFCTECVFAKFDSLKRPGNSLIGGLVAVHREGSDGKCSLPDLKGILTVEAILYSREEINSKKHLNLTSVLGCDIRDTCPSPYQAALDLVLNSNNRMVAALGNLPHHLLQHRQSLLLLYSSQTPHMSCISSTFKLTSEPDLISRSEFIFHVVSRDVSNIQAAVDLVVRLNWTYVAVVYDASTYGQYSLELFNEATEKKFVCVFKRYALPSNASHTQIQSFIKTMKAEKNFSVIVMLTAKSIFKSVIDEAFKQKVSDLTWVAVDTAWDDKAEIPNDNSAARGMFKVGTSASLVHFKEHLDKLLSFPERNKWIMEMVAVNSSNLDPKTTKTAATSRPSTQALTSAPLQTASSESTPSAALPTSPYAPTPCIDPPCGVNKTYLRHIVNELKAMAESATCIIDSVFAVAHALSAKEKCTVHCPESHEFYQFIQKVDFVGPSGHRISFNPERNLNETEYKIWNFQKTVDGSPVSVKEKNNLRLVPVGSWKQSGGKRPELTLRKSSLIEWNTNAKKIPKSVCNDPCRPGTYKVFKMNRSEAECCWHCLRCPVNAVSKVEDSLSCSLCPEGSTANSVQNGCITQFEDYVYWRDPWSLVMVFLMVAGICFSLYVSAVLFRNRDTPVMRRAKNAMLGMLPFVIILFLIPIPLLCKPSASSCDGYRSFFIIALGIPLALLISKCVYVDSKFYDSDGQIKESWGNCVCTPRVVFAIGTMMVHIVVTCIIVLLLPNEILRFPTDDPYTVYIECSFHAGFGFLVVIFYILAVATLYSVLSMSEEVTPENDMEVKWTSFCMFNWYVLCFVYVVFAYGLPGKGKIFALSFVDFLFAMNVLTCIYVPKWCVILFQPEKNQADVSPWSMYVKTQEKVSARLSDGREESPVLPKRGTLASTANELRQGRGDKAEAQGLIFDTDV